MIVIFGTRPEAIKLGPVVAELRSMGVRPTIICTNQHQELLRGTPAETDLSGGISLGLPSTGYVDEWIESSVPKIHQAMGEDGIVVVQGDTMSALAGARAAKGRILCHVEAGVRSHCLTDPWPEEEFRREIDELATWMYAPTSVAYGNLVQEGRRMERIRLTGNTGVSALARYSDAKPTLHPQNTVLITLHRREFLRSKLCRSTIAEVFVQAEKRPEITYVWPAHPAVMGLLPPVLSERSNVQIIQPLSYREATRLLASSLGVLTDSGGLQEEAATLGVPCAVLRNVTDRPESIQAGVAELFAPNPDGVRDAMKALDPVNETLVGARIPMTIYGHSDAALMVARHLSQLEEM